MASPALSGNQRRFLRALAHPLKPVVQIGHAGLTPAVLREIEGALEQHELIKVRVGREAPTPAEELVPELEKATGGAVAQVIGHVLALYRARRKDPKIVLPRPRKRPARV
jgi:RNA-binding protein